MSLRVLTLLLLAVFTGVLSSLYISGSTPLNLEVGTPIAHDALLSGTLTCETGDPISGAKIEVTNAAGASLELSTEIFTDKSGSFSITGLQGGELYGLRLKKEGWSLTPIDRVYVFTEENIELNASPSVLRRVEISGYLETYAARGEILMFKDLNSTGSPIGRLEWHKEVLSYELSLKCEYAKLRLMDGRESQLLRIPKPGHTESNLKQALCFNFLPPLSIALKGEFLQASKVPFRPSIRIVRVEPKAKAAKAIQKLRRANDVFGKINQLEFNIDCLEAGDYQLAVYDHIWGNPRQVGTKRFKLPLADVLGVPIYEDEPSCVLEFDFIDSQNRKLVDLVVLGLKHKCVFENGIIKAYPISNFGFIQMVNEEYAIKLSPVWNERLSEVDCKHYFEIEVYSPQLGKLSKWIEVSGQNKNRVVLESPSILHLDCTEINRADLRNSLSLELLQDGRVICRRLLGRSQVKVFGPLSSGEIFIRVKVGKLILLERPFTLNPGENHCSIKLPPIHSLTIFGRSRTQFKLRSFGQAGESEGLLNHFNYFPYVAQGSYYLKVANRKAVQVDIFSDLILDYSSCMNAMVVSIDSSAWLAGLGFEDGDKILKVQGQAANSAKEWNMIAQALMAGKAMQLLIERSNRTITLSIPGVKKSKLDSLGGSFKLEN